jgi:hypothetical protein
MQMVAFQRVPDNIVFIAYIGTPIAYIVFSRKPTLFDVGFIFR